MWLTLFIMFVFEMTLEKISNLGMVFQLKCLPTQTHTVTQTHLYCLRRLVWRQLSLSKHVNEHVLQEHRGHEEGDHEHHGQAATQRQLSAGQRHAHRGAAAHVDVRGLRGLPRLLAHTTGGVRVSV